MSDLVKDNLCSNDPRSAFYIELDDDPRPARVNCFCENCFSGKDKLAVRIAELEKQIQEIETVSDFNADRVAELEAELAEKPAYHCPKCDSWFSEGELKALAGERLTIRQVHRNGVECVHGRFLHERCDLCEGETK